MIVYHTPEGEILRWSTSGMGDLPGLTPLETDVTDPTDCRVVGGQVVPLPPRPDGHVRFNYAAGAWVPDNAAADAEARADRRRRLQDSDWTQVADAPVDHAAWATYRQALRDVTAQPGYPHKINWPVPPRG
jgi:hypothetical protein